jgi:hypothetical protein
MGAKDFLGAAPVRLGGGGMLEVGGRGGHRHLKLVLTGVDRTGTPMRNRFTDKIYSTGWD